MTIIIIGYIYIYILLQIANYSRLAQYMSLPILIVVWIIVFIGSYSRTIPNLYSATIM